VELGFIRWWIRRNRLLPVYGEMREPEDGMVRAECVGMEANTVVDQYLPYVRFVARRMRTMAPKTLEFDDLVAAGVVGLLEASKRYQPDRGCSFASFAYHRIQGAIYRSFASIGYRRSLRRDSSGVLLDACFRKSALPERPPTPEDLASRYRLYGRLAKAIEHLAPRKQYLLRRYYRDGVHFAQISAE